MKEDPARGERTDIALSLLVAVSSKLVIGINGNDFVVGYPNEGAVYMFELLPILPSVQIDSPSPWAVRYLPVEQFAGKHDFVGLMQPIEQNTRLTIK